jgi:CheY-like chemotaxis protein
MDGVETTRKIRKLPGYEKVPVIAMTAFAMKGDREDLLNDGMDDYISKPFKTLELKKIINTVLSKSNI